LDSPVARLGPEPKRNDMAKVQEREYIVASRAIYNSNQVVVKSDLLVGNEDGTFGVWDSTTNKISTRVQYNAERHLIRIALFHDKDEGGGHLIAGNAPACIVMKSEAFSSSASKRPGKRYLEGFTNEHGENVQGVWAFYLEVPQDRMDAIVAARDIKGAGRTKVMWEQSDPDWDEREYAPTQFKYWTEVPGTSESAEPQQEEAA